MASTPDINALVIAIKYFRDTPAAWQALCTLHNGTPTIAAILAASEQRQLFTLCIGVPVTKQSPTPISTPLPGHSLVRVAGLSLYLEVTASQCKALFSRLMSTPMVSPNPRVELLVPPGTQQVKLAVVTSSHSEALFALVTEAFRAAYGSSLKVIARVGPYDTVYIGEGAVTPVDLIKCYSNVYQIMSRRDASLARLIRPMMTEYINGAYPFYVVPLLPEDTESFVIDLFTPR